MDYPLWITLPSKLALDDLGRFERVSKQGIKQPQSLPYRYVLEFDDISLHENSQLSNQQKSQHTPCIDKYICMLSCGCASNVGLDDRDVNRLCRREDIHTSRFHYAEMAQSRWSNSRLIGQRALRHCHWNLLKMKGIKSLFTQPTISTFNWISRTGWAIQCRIYKNYLLKQTNAQPFSFTTSEKAELNNFYFE